MVKVALCDETIKLIDTFRIEFEREMGYLYGREEIIEKALTALYDVRNG